MNPQDIMRRNTTQNIARSFQNGPLPPQPAPAPPGWLPTPPGLLTPPTQGGLPLRLPPRQVSQWYYPDLMRSAGRVDNPTGNWQGQGQQAWNYADLMRSAGRVDNPTGNWQGQDRAVAKPGIAGTGSEVGGSAGQNYPAPGAEPWYGRVARALIPYGAGQIAHSIGHGIRYRRGNEAALNARSGSQNGNGPMNAAGDPSGVGRGIIDSGGDPNDYPGGGQLDPNGDWYDPDPGALPGLEDSYYPGDGPTVQINPREPNYSGISDAGGPDRNSPTDYNNPYGDIASMLAGLPGIAGQLDNRHETQSFADNPNQGESYAGVANSMARGREEGNVRYNVGALSRRFDPITGDMTLGPRTRPSIGNQEVRLGRTPGFENPYRRTHR